MDFRINGRKKPFKELPEEAQFACRLRAVGFKVDRAHLTIRAGVPVHELELAERVALAVLKTKYHFLVLED